MRAILCDFCEKKLESIYLFPGGRLMVKAMDKNGKWKSKEICAQCLESKILKAGALHYSLQQPLTGSPSFEGSPKFAQAQTSVS